MFQQLEDLHRRALALRLFPSCLALHDVRVRTMKGGLEATSVVHVSANRAATASRPFIVKELAGWTTREAAIYHGLATRGLSDLAPRLLAVEEHAPECLLLYLEALKPRVTWPWRDHNAVIAVAETLARFHAAHSDAPEALSAWNYEAHLEWTASATIGVLEACQRTPEFSALPRVLPHLRRVASSLPEMRRWLFSLSEFGVTLIHGDVHPGNVRICRSSRRDEVKLIDWARARFGSPLEDVSSWLQSVAYWEPEARRKHDSVLVAYLSARGKNLRITSEVRAAYWIAAASNALGGALLYHIARARENRTRQAQAVRAASDWLRIIRRADEHWRWLHRSHRSEKKRPGRSFEQPGLVKHAAPTSCAGDGTR